MELTLFVIVGAIAVIAAAMMLVSENAVYSALFLILNFACIAFLFLMLNAPFLAMVQITVYAGAIMVLFLFVIMLLGAERVMHFTPSRYRWLTPIAIVLGVIFLITASVAIIGGEIDLAEPQRDAPTVRAVNVFDERDADDDDAVDVYIDGKLLAGDVDFGDGSEFEQWEPGRYTVAAYRAGEVADTADPLVESLVDVNKGEAVSLVVIGRAAGVPGPDLAIVTHDASFSGSQDGLRLAAVNAVPEWNVVDLVDDKTNVTLAAGLAYGQAVEVEVDEGEYDLGLYPAGDHRTALIAMSNEELQSHTSVLLVFAEQWAEGNAFTDTVIKLEAKGPASFGSPTHVGRLLFSRYVLPFEMVSLLLLVAMIGAIVLTHEALGKRRRVVRRLANPPAGLEEPATGETGK